MIQIDSLVANASHVSRKKQAVFLINATRNEVEFCDEGMFEPIAQQLTHPNNPCNTLVVRHFTTVHSLAVVQQQNQAQKECQLKPFANITGENLKQTWLVVFLKNCRLDFGKISSNEKSNFYKFGDRMRLFDVSSNVIDLPKREKRDSTYAGLHLQNSLPHSM